MWQRTNVSLEFRSDRKRCTRSGKACDAAWAEIAGNFGNDPGQIEVARLKIATRSLEMPQTTDATSRCD